VKFTHHLVKFIAILKGKLMPKYALFSMFEKNKNMSKKKKIL